MKPAFASVDSVQMDASPLQEAYWRRMQRGAASHSNADLEAAAQCREHLDPKCWVRKAGGDEKGGSRTAGAVPLR